MSSPPESTDEERHLSLLSVSNVISCPLNVSDYSSFVRLKRVTAWIFRFTKNGLSRKQGTQRVHHTFLTTSELHFAEQCLYSVAQRDHFVEEIESLKKSTCLEKSSQLLNLRPFVNSAGLLRVGGRQQHAKLSFSKKHPIVLHHKHPLTHVIVRSY